MSVPLHLAEKKTSEVLLDVARALPAEAISLGELLERLGGHGLLTTCILLALPFVVPVSIPGVSIVFGLLVALIALGIITHRLPWLPRRLLARPLPAARLARVLERGARWFARLERLVRPRLLPLTAGSVMVTLNGIVLLAGGLLLMMPLGLVPLTNTLPALAILFAATGILQRDGYCVLAGYLALLTTLVYFAALAGGAWLAGEGLRAFFSGPSLAVWAG